MFYVRILCCELNIIISVLRFCSMRVFFEKYGCTFIEKCVLFKFGDVSHIGSYYFSVFIFLSNYSYQKKNQVMRQVFQKRKKKKGDTYVVQVHTERTQDLAPLYFPLPLIQCDDVILLTLLHPFVLKVSLGICLR